MKALRIILLVALTSLLTSCGAPLVNNALGIPANIIKAVAKPVLGGLM